MQIIDVSDKMLYNEFRAEKSFLTLINAAVSHELRNPLNSLTGQITSMLEFFTDFNNILNYIEDFDIQSKLRKIYENIYNCGKKMASATKFIDFFVHDILDYTILNKDKDGFIKNITVFNIKEAVDEIVDTLADKVDLKQLDVSLKMYGFKKDKDYLVKSDQKRIQ